MIPQGGRTGYWSPYNNATDPQNQTPTKPPAAMADKIAVTPGGVCAGNAFASSATGQDNYVGFGAKFHPQHAADRRRSSAMRYNVSAYDGITFRAKTGGGPTTQPVFVEVLTKETQPSTSGGTATVQAIDLYNNRGYFANVTGTMQQFFVPFGAMIPRSLPATGTGGANCPAAAGGVPQLPGAEVQPDERAGDPVLVLRPDGHAGVPEPEPGRQLQPGRRRRGVLQALRAAVRDVGSARAAEQHTAS